MKKLSTILTAVLFITILSEVAWGQTSGDYRSVATGNWNSTSTWERFDGSSWVAASATPASADGVITIRNGQTVTVTDTVTVDQVTVDAGGQITLNSNVTLTISNGTGTDLTINGTFLNQGTISISSSATWTVGTGGTYIHNNSNAITGQLTGSSFASTSTFTYRGSSSLTPSISISGRTYGNLIFESSSGSWSTGATPSTGNLTINGNLLIGSGVTWSIGGPTTSLSGIISVSGTTTVNGTWTNTSGSTGNLGTHSFTGTFTINGTYSVATTGSTQGDINFAGDVANNGTFTTPSNRTIIFNGITVQAIGGTNPTTFNQNLTINNASGVSLSNSITVTGTLTLTSGLLTLGSNNLTLGSSATIGGTPSASNMIVATGSGELRKTFTGIGSFTFPVGDNTGTAEYSPVILNFTSGTFSSAYAGLKLVNSKHSNNSSSSHYISRYWTVTSSGVSDFSCNATFTYVDADITGTESSLYCGAWNGSSWTLLNAVDAGNNQLSGTISSFSDFTGGEQSALPVEIVSLTATSMKNIIELKWTTATETQNYGFEVERAKKRSQSSIVNREKWEKVGFVKGAGNSNSPKEYSFVDKTALYGTYSYRLKQIDLNSSFEYSDAVLVTIGSKPQVYDVKNFPNPFNPVTNIRYELPDAANVNLAIYNILGEKVATLVDEFMEEGIYQETFDASAFGGLPSGIYFSVLKAGGVNVIRKMQFIK